MLKFESFVARHGEFTVQALIEKIERYEGLQPEIGISLKQRWTAVMQPQAPTAQRMAA